MEIYRLAQKDYATLDGMGGMFSSGRWHQRDVKVTYAASSRSLAVLERFIHCAPTTIPNMVMITIFVPDDIAYEHLVSSQLPDNWDTITASDQDDTQALGMDFLTKNKHAYLKVPSAIVPHEYNYILNPNHPDSPRIIINEVHPYQFDARYQRFIKE